MKKTRKSTLATSGLSLIFMGICIITAVLTFEKEAEREIITAASAILIPIFIWTLYHHLKPIAKKNRDITKYSVTAQHFLYNAVIMLFTTVWICMWVIYILPKEDSDPMVYLSIPVALVPVLFARFKFVRKINLKAFDEWETQISLQAERAAALVTAYSGVILLALAKLTEPYFAGYQLLGASFVIYHIAFNVAGWYYFRKNERELKMENGE